MCLKCELLDIIRKEAELKREKTLLSKENYLTTGLPSSSRIMMRESQERPIGTLFLSEYISLLESLKITQIDKLGIKFL